MQVRIGWLLAYGLLVCPGLACSTGVGGGTVAADGATSGATGAATDEPGASGSAGATGTTASAGTSGSAGASSTSGAAGAPGGAGGQGQGGAAGVADGGDAGSSSVLPPSSADAGVRQEVAHVLETASTNTPEINVSIYADASAERKVGSGNVQYVADKSYPAASPEVMTFLAELRLVGDVSMMPTASGCVKSVSFGTRTIVSAGGETSGDVQCLLATATDADVQLALAARKLDGTIQ
jgi:hypothetical protein